VAGQLNLADQISALHEQLILRHPLVTIAIIAVLMGFFGWHAQDFGLDASAESLTLERDADLNYYRLVKARYGSDDYLIVTFAPKQDLFTDPVLLRLDSLRTELNAIDSIESVVSILDVPLFKSPPVALRQFSKGVRRLEEGDTDRELARQELLNSPLYRDRLISADGRTTALAVNLRRNELLMQLRELRDELREKKYLTGLTDDEVTSLATVTVAFKELSLNLLTTERQTISAVRQILDDYDDVATLHLGGVPMIVADSIDFIRHDLTVFGVAVVVLLVIVLMIAFRQPRWALLSLVNCLATSIIMLGILGLTNWPVTVVSSNFLSLLVILCLALTLHIIVRYREIHAGNPDADQLTLVRESVKRIAVPCFYTALTTMVAFGSLLVSGIRPVIDFGWMMVIGIGVGFVFSFTLFPACLMLLQPPKPRALRDITTVITGFFARLIDRRIWQTLVIFAVFAVAGIIGITKLTVENRFIDYYKKSTEIYQGMELIDRVLGGTTPLDVIIDAPLVHSNLVELEGDADADDEFEDIFADDVEGEGGISAESYWFNYPRISEITAIHDYLDALPETGKVISAATTARVLGELDNTILTDNMLLSIVYKRMSEDVKAALFSPYMSSDGDQLRFSVRVFESDKSLRRNELISRIRTDLIEQFGLAEDQIHLSGMLVLYNNMLQSLYRSQVLTIGAVFLAIFVMFVLVFRSLRLAATAIIPNVVSAVVILGLMGWLAIPLDLMTITIAAITVGIAVDDTIHYVHRFMRELERDGDYWAAIHRCHHTIGRAMYYTSVTIMLGFSILALSQFNPTVYFGLLTGSAMLIALLANMTLLPVLIVVFRSRTGANVPS
jgi:predicted RND superfamily exporter protein